MQSSIGPTPLTVGKSDKGILLSPSLPHIHIGTLYPDTESSVPTVTDNLYDDGTISADQIGIFFEPTTATSPGNGEIAWGTFTFV